MTGVSDTAAQAAIGAAARELKLPTVRDQAARLAEIAVRERHTHLAYLAEVLAAELFLHLHHAREMPLERLKAGWRELVRRAVQAADAY